jgi:3-oxoacyl-[acyl-carrier-protein] synthase II
MVTQSGTRRVVVTGMGLVSPVGLDVQSSWQCMLAGKSGGGPVTAFEATEPRTSPAASAAR